MNELNRFKKKYMPKDDEWYKDPKDWRSGYSDKAKKWMDISDKEYEKYSNEASKLYEKRQSEQSDARKKYF